MLLSEAAALADVFVFRLMFRVYEVPRLFAPGAADDPAAASAGAFHESKRLLAAFAVRTRIVKRRHNARTVEYSRYLLISALTLDTGAAACTALSGGLCGIYDRRPLACRALPFHYSRPEASAERDLAAFVGTEGRACDTGGGAPVVLAQGRIVDPGSLRTREAALQLRALEGRWQDSILHRLKTGFGTSLPSLAEIEANAGLGATTTSMRVAWQIAAEAGLIGADACRALIAAQAGVIERELAGQGGRPDARETLAEMRAEYRLWLNG
jgi:Fe-S-cluster containining protein